MRILVTGASGMVGSSLAFCLRGSHEVTGTYARNPVALGGVPMHRMDLADGAEIARVLRSARPELVVHAAAMTDVDGAEADPATARALNAEGARLVAVAARAAGADLVHVSTDAVFDGSRGAWRESDATAPLNVYGASKREGEREVLSAHDGALVVRTTPVGFAPRGDQITAWVLGRLRAGDEVPGFVDAMFSPIDVDALGHAALALVARGARGILHLAGGSAVSKHDFAVAMARACGLDAGLVRPARLAAVALAAPRGADMTLDSSLAGTLGAPGPPTLEEVAAALARLDEAGRPQEAAGMLAAAATRRGT